MQSRRSQQGTRLKGPQNNSPLFRSRGPFGRKLLPLAVVYCCSSFAWCKGKVLLFFIADAVEVVCFTLFFSWEFQQ